MLQSTQNTLNNVVRKFVVGMLAWAGISAAPSAQTVIQLPDSLWNAGDTITWVKRVAQFCEGPAWEPSTGAVYFTRQISGAQHWPIYKIRPGVDTGDVFIAQPRQANGLAFDPQGRLVAAQNQRLTRYKSDGSEDSILVASGANGVSFNLANDLSIGSNGAIYFTTNGSQVYYLSPTRQLSIAYTGATSANGVYWIEEDSAVYVHESRQVKRYTVGPGGALSNPTTFITVAAGSGGTYADGGTIDIHGNRYVANFTQGNLKIFNANGDSIGFIVPRLATGTSYDAFTGNMGNVSNAVFGGADMKTLYFTGDGGLYSIRLKIPGRPAIPGTVSLRARVDAARAAEAASAAVHRDVRGRLLPSEGSAATPRVPAKAPAR